MDELTSKTFDKYPSIQYKDITHLYWKKFPYKVAIGRPIHIERASNLYRKIRRTLTLTGVKPGNVKVMNSGGQWSFFFLNGDDALNFIDANKKLVFEVCRPRSQEDVKVLIQDHHHKIRDTLFWNKYRWNVIFKSTWNVDTDAIDEWLREFFGDITYESERSFVSYSEQRRVYLNDESDVLMVKMGLSEYISKIEKAILKGEFNEGNAD